MLFGFLKFNGLSRTHVKLQQWYRVSEGREATPSTGCIDSQSTKIASRLASPEAVGIDGNKLVNGRKRNLLVDTLGLMMMVVVTAANVNDRKGVWQRFVSKKDTSPEILFRQWFQTRILIISN